MNLASCSQFTNNSRKLLLLIFTSLIPFNVAAEWSGSFQTGFNYTNNLGSQRTVEQGLGTSDPISRSGWVNQGNLLWQSLNANGGESLNLFGIIDKDSDIGSDNRSDTKDLVLSASLFRALNPLWLWRFSGNYQRYRDDAVLASGFDGYGANLTFGYFGKNYQGLDLTFAWKKEDHSLDPLFQYITIRKWVNLLYYLPHAKGATTWSIQGQIRNNNSDNYRDYNSYLLGLRVAEWSVGDLQGLASLQWRKNVYDSLRDTGNNTLSAQMHMSGGGNNETLVSAQDVNDQLLSTLVKFSVPLARQWRLQMSAESGRYTVSTGGNAQNYYRISSSLNWRF